MERKDSGLENQVEEISPNKQKNRHSKGGKENLEDIRSNSRQEKLTCEWQIPRERHKWKQENHKE